MNNLATEPGDLLLIPFLSVCILGLAVFWVGWVLMENGSRLERRWLNWRKKWKSQ